MIETLRARAEAGEAEAQYRLAAFFNSRGDNENARLWLDRAAEGGHVDALFTSSAAKLAGAGGTPRDRAAGLEGLRRAAAGDSAGAMRLLAALHAIGAIAPKDRSAAIGYLINAVALGDRFAKRDAALALFMTDADDLDGAALIEEAAAHDAAAAVVAVRRATLGRKGASTKRASGHLERLASAGHPLTNALRNAFQGAATKEETPPQISVENVGKKLSRFEEPATIALTSISLQPSVKIAKQAFSPEECDFLVCEAAPRVAPTLIQDERTDQGRLHPYRTAWGASFLAGSLNLPLALLTHRLSLIANLPYENGEGLNILRYREGDEYRPHHDFLSEKESDLARGQRIRTVLVYLNDGYSGGETHFLQPDLKVRGDVGDAIVFDNVDETGAPDTSARHAGLPVGNDEKWLASLWFRDRPYEP